MNVMIKLLDTDTRVMTDCESSKTTIWRAPLFTVSSTYRRRVAHRRIAANSIITVQMQENVPLTNILEVCTSLDVLYFRSISYNT